MSRSDNLTILNNSDPILQLTCTAGYPTEWVANFDDVSDCPAIRNFPYFTLRKLDCALQLDVNGPGRHLIEWTDRKFDTSIDETSYKHIAWIQLQYQQGLREEERLVCRSVASHSDSVLVTLRPTADSKKIHITKHPSEESVQMGNTNAAAASPKPAACNLKFEVTQVANKYYWRCLAAAGRPQIKMYTCGYSGQASSCANTFRSLKALPTCLTVRSDLPSAQVITDLSWNAMPATYLDKGGQAVCSASGWDREIGRAHV